MKADDFRSLLATLDALSPEQAEKLQDALTQKINKFKLKATDNPASQNGISPEATDKVIIYTDGACSGNPGPGGWGATLIYGDKRKDIKGGETETTNNRMELMAAIQALETLKKPVKIALWTDSTYLRKGITEWINGWKKNGWKTAAKKPVKNADLWQRLDACRNSHDIDWHWVKGHAGHPENEHADALARAGMAPYL